jgi:hypothetical protein
MPAPPMKKPTLVRSAYAVFPAASRAVWFLRGIAGAAPRVLLLYGSASFSKAAAALYSGYVTIFCRPSP